MKILSDNSFLKYSGRIDFTDPLEPLFIYAGSMVKIDFSGTKIGIYVKNEPLSEYSAIGAVVDGLQYKIELVQDSEEHFYSISDNLNEGKHSLVIFKRQAAAHYFRLTGIYLEDYSEVFSVNIKEKLKIEVFGDSVSAGEVVEAVFFEGHSDPEKHNGFYDNSWFSYPLSLSRKLNAEVYNNSQGGLALFDKTGYFNGDDYVGLETTFDKMSYVPYSREGYTLWDFSRFIPDYVIIAIGQNDANPNPSAIFDGEYSRRWKDKYIEIIHTIKLKYGSGTKVILLLTLLMHDQVWDKIIAEITQELNDNTVRHCYFKRCGKATPGHPRITEQEEMALEMADFISKWNDVM